MRCHFIDFLKASKKKENRKTGGGNKVKIRGKKVKQGIKIKAVGLTKEEKKHIENAMRKIKYGRKKDNRQSLPYLIELK